MAQTAMQKKEYTEDDYNALPEDVRAELIDGHLYYMSAPSRIHQKILGDLYAVIYNYIRTKNGACEVYPAPFAVKLFDDKKNIVEPDISVICDTRKLTDRGCSGAPDWIIEIISPSNSGNDYVRKLNLYADAGVREYWIIDPSVREIYVYLLEQGSFRAVVYTFLDTIKVHIYKDFWIDLTEFSW